MTVAIYIRVSTEEQAMEGYSISAQREKLKAYCVAQGWEDIRFYIEEGVSGKTTNRPKLKELLQHVEQGSIQTLLVYRLDRLTRSVRDLHKLLDTLEMHKCTFKSATEVYDTSTAMGRMFITIIASISQWESENLGERVRMGQIEKARQGEWSAQPPFGFRKENKRLVQDPEKVEILRDMIDKIEQGYSLRKLANYLTTKGIKPVRGYQWHITSILSMLSNHALYGAMRWREEIIPNTHEGILSKKEFLKLQDLISSRQNQKKRDVRSVFIFQMKLRCPECKSHLTSERSVYLRKSDNIQVENNAYRCQVCALRGVRSPFRISEKFVIRSLSEYFQSFTLAKQRETVAKTAYEGNRIKRLQQDLMNVENQRSKYQKAWAMDLMTDAEFTKQMRETKDVIDTINKELEAIQIEPSYRADAEVIRETAHLFNENWQELTVHEKREFVERFIKSIELVRYGKSRGRGYRDFVYEIKNIDFR